MRKRVLLHTMALISLTGLFLSSCGTVAPTAESPKSATKTSPAQERYKKIVEDQLGLLWYRLTKNNEAALQLGTVITTFEIPATGGKVRNLRVTSNTGGRMDELFARRAIDQLRAPPVPPEILEQLDQAYMAFEESFTVFEQP